MPLIHTECLTLRRRRTRDADALVTLFSRQCGKVTASTRSALKTASRYAGVTQPFNRLHVVLYAKTEDQEIWTLTQTALIRQYQSLQEDLSRMAYASCLAEWIDLLSGDFESNAEVWDLLLNAFERWDAGTPLREDLFFYQWHLLMKAGLQPEITRCRDCGREEQSGWFYRPDQGGLVCNACRSEGVFLSGGAVQALRKIAGSDSIPAVRLSANQKKEITLALKIHLEYYMGAQPRANLFLEQISRINDP